MSIPEPTITITRSHTLRVVAGHPWLPVPIVRVVDITDDRTIDIALNRLTDAIADEIATYAPSVAVDEPLVEAPTARPKARR